MSRRPLTVLAKFSLRLPAPSLRSTKHARAKSSGSLRMNSIRACLCAINHQAHARRRCPATPNKTATSCAHESPFPGNACAAIPRRRAAASAPFVGLLSPVPTNNASSPRRGSKEPTGRDGYGAETLSALPSVGVARNKRKRFAFLSRSASTCLRDLWYFRKSWI